MYLQSIASILDLANGPGLKMEGEAFTRWAKSEGGLNRLTREQAEFLATATKAAIQAGFAGSVIKDILKNHPPVELERDGNLVKFPTPTVTR